MNPFLRIDGTVETVPVFTNVKYDIPLVNSVSLELGAGIGAAYTQIDQLVFGRSILSDEAWELAYQGIAGLIFKLNNNIDFKAGYRFLGISNINEALSNDDLTAHYFGGGLNIRF